MAAAPTPPSPDTAITVPFRIGWLGILVVGVVIASALSLAIGSRPMDVNRLLHALGPALESLRSGSTGGSDGEIIANLRLPRTMLALAIGAALGVAGAIAQGHTRNPLAEPGLLGISAGAAFAVIVANFAMGSVSTTGSIVAAFVGSCLTAALVFGITSIGGGTKTLTLILAGAAVTALMTSLTSALVLSDSRSLDRLRFWTIGSVAGVDLSVAGIIAPLLLIGLLAALATAPTLNLLSLGDDVAASLGVNTTAARFLVIGLIAFLAGTATAAAGPISFIGLFVPHLARSFTGPDHRWLLPTAGLVGAIVLTLADVAGRVIVPKGEVEVGVVLAFIGAPFFIAIVRRRRLVSG